MDFQSSRAQLALDAAAMSVLTAWENSQQQHSRHNTGNAVVTHRPPMHYNSGFPISPITPSSSPPSSAGLTLGNQWTATGCPSSSTTMGEYEMAQFRQAMMPAPAAIAEHEPLLPVNAQSHSHAHSHFNFDFSVAVPSIPQLPFQQQLAHHRPQQPQQQRCSPPLPTPTTPSSSTLFSSPPVSPSNNMGHRRGSPSGTKRTSDESSSSSATSAKKPRAYTSLKDYVPPDVTGLSKREARLVKNRAAAFLSRQRKREEFELMEIRVAELERENARLREFADGASPDPSSSIESSELDLLRMQLAASRQREVELVHRLEMLKHEQQKIKMEANEPSLSDGDSSGSSSPVIAPTMPFKNIVTNPKAGASLGLMVLLCALPSLLVSQPSSHPRATLPTAQSFLDTIQWDAPSSIFNQPTSASASATIDEIPSWELDFSGTRSGATAGGGGNNMDMDVDNSYARREEEQEEQESEWQKLELGLDGSEAMGSLGGLGLGSLDISFSTTRTKDGKFRVRVQSSSTTPNDLTNMGASASASLPSPAQTHSGSTPELADRTNTNINPLTLSFADADPLGPFLGAGSSPTNMGSFELGAPFDLALASSGSRPVAEQLMSGLSGFDAATPGLRTGERRRVRIALRSLPQQGGEGGEWEIEVR